MVKKVELSMKGRKKNIMDFAGAFADNSDEWEKIKKRIYEDRKKFKLRNFNLGKLGCSDS